MAGALCKTNRLIRDLPINYQDLLVIDYSQLVSYIDALFSCYRPCRISPLYVTYHMTSTLPPSAGQDVRLENQHDVLLFILLCRNLVINPVAGDFPGVFKID